MGKISVVINTQDEKSNLPKAIASVKNMASEIVVCDSGSKDGTVEIAKKLGAKVYSFKGVGYVEPARNFAISKAKNEWILILDADEEVTPKLGTILKNISQSHKADYFRIPRKNMIFGKWMKHSRWWPDYNIRFFKKGKVSWNEVIHAVPMTVGKGVDLEENEQNSILHNHYDSIEQYIERMNKYTGIQAKLKAEERYKFNYLDLISKPSGEFLSRFFAGRGYLDGIHGLAVSLLQAFSEVVLYLKLWQMEKFEDTDLVVKDVKKEVGKVRKDFNYWFADALNQRFKRKFKIF